MSAVRTAVAALLVAVSAMAQAAPRARPAVAKVSSAAHRQAVAANTAGLRFFKSGQLPRAALRFRDALSFDPDYVLAHYNLACVSSRLRASAAALDELQWLAASPDPLAKTKLAKALVDPDLDFVSVLPAVREILVLARFDPEHPLAWLSERGGVWSAELPRDDCAQRSYRFDVQSDGELELTVREQCRATAPARQQTFDGDVRVDDKGALFVSVRNWAQWPREVRLAFVPCPGLDAPASCFVLDGDRVEIGPFHRGVAGMSPMRARKSLAAAP